MGKQLIILAVLLLVAPAITGGLFLKSNHLGNKLIFRWVSGQFLLWAGFQLICVPLILREEEFGRLTQLFAGYMTALALLSIAVEIQRLVKRQVLPWRYRLRKHIPKQHAARLRPSEQHEPRQNAPGSHITLRHLPWQKLRKGNKVQQSMPGQESRQSGAGQVPGALLWLVFWGVLLLQLFQAVRLSYADTDDAFYVAISSITQESETMYQKLPYTGGTTQLDARHGLAPFPIWISYLGRMSGMPAVTVAKVVLPVVLIAMAYGIFYLLGKVLFPEKGRQLPQFLLFAELLVLFGNTSIYTAENFLIARSRQGKAALGSIVVPFLLFLLLLLLKKMQEKERIPVSHFFLLAAVAITGCLCSTLGALLVCLAVGIAGVLGAFCYKRFGVLFPMAACCVPCLAYAFLYVFFG